MASNTDKSGENASLDILSKLPFNLNPKSLGMAGVSALMLALAPASTPGASKAQAIDSPVGGYQTLTGAVVPSLDGSGAPMRVAVANVEAPAEVIQVAALNLTPEDRTAVQAFVNLAPEVDRLSEERARVIRGLDSLKGTSDRMEELFINSENWIKRINPSDLQTNITLALEFGKAADHLYACLDTTQIQEAFENMPDTVKDLYQAQWDACIAQIETEKTAIDEYKLFFASMATRLEGEAEDRKRARLADSGAAKAVLDALASVAPEAAEETVTLPEIPENLKLAAVTEINSPNMMAWATERATANPEGVFVYFENSKPKVFTAAQQLKIDGAEPVDMDHRFEIEFDVSIQDAEGLAAPFPVDLEIPEGVDTSETIKFALKGVYQGDKLTSLAAVYQPDIAEGEPRFDLQIASNGGYLLEALNFPGFSDPVVNPTLEFDGQPVSEKNGQLYFFAG